MREAFNITRKDSILMWSLIGFILAISGYAQFNSTLPQFLSNTSNIENGAKLFSILMALNAIVVVTFQFPLLKIGKKYSPLISILFGNIISSLSLLGFGLSTSAPMWMIMMAIFTVGEILMFSMTDMFMDSIAKAELRGTYFGAMGFLQLGNVIGPVVGGLLLDSFGFEKPLLVFGLLCSISILGVPILLYVHRKMKRVTVVQNSSVLISK